MDCRPPAGDSDLAMPELTPVAPAPVAGPGLGCQLCDRTSECTASEFLRFSGKGFPWCCGAAMPPRPLPGSSFDGGAGTGKQPGKRRPARHGSLVEFRRGATGLGPDIGVGPVGGG